MAITSQKPKFTKAGGPSAPPWNGPDAVKSIYNFRQALLVNDGKIVEDGSVLDAISGDYSDTEANNVTVNQTVHILMVSM